VIDSVPLGSTVKITQMVSLKCIKMLNFVRKLLQKYKMSMAHKIGISKIAKNCKKRSRADLELKFESSFLKEFYIDLKLNFNFQRLNNFVNKINDFTTQSLKSFYELNINFESGFL